MKRTTIVLDAESRDAARDLAGRWQCSMSEAIRRAIVHQHSAVSGVSASERAERVRALLALAEAFEGHDAETEIAELKRQDEWG